MFKWRLLVEDGRKAGHTFSQPDLIIAATALHHELTVVSRDVSDYQKARACTGCETAFLSLKVKIVSMLALRAT
jgi:predicted nucleic acid-binding protein